jgi:dihydroxyacetone kinase phosphotransfer subunit
MVNLVIVSHSRRLAEGVCEVARQMADDHVRIVPVGGIREQPENAESEWLLGTNALEIANAIDNVMSVDGVVVLVDLGSACFAAEEALELLPPQMRASTLLSNAPLVEGAIVAAVEASMGRSLPEVNAAAEEACRTPKR